ncbi:hypothetical protein C7S13_7872 [Burkholderia cepacia]|nr:hypothetical protein [Burkholderia cepacia]
MATIMSAPYPHSESTFAAQARRSYAGNQGGRNPSKLRAISSIPAFSDMVKSCLYRIRRRILPGNRCLSLRGGKQDMMNVY